MSAIVIPSISTAEVELALRPTADRRIAAMLYGSHARKGNEVESDVDVLELVADSPTPYSVGEINVTQYTPSHLGAMGQRGSLFVLHLRTDGVTISDPTGALQTALDQYRAPASYAPIWRQLSVVAGAVNPSSEDADRYASGLARLGIYALRTAIYISAIEAGAPCFDVDVAAERMSVPRLAEVLKWRRRADFTLADVATLSELLTKVLPMPIRTNSRSTAAYAVANSNTPDLAALFTTVLGEGEIEYSALSVPPF